VSRLPIHWPVFKVLEMRVGARAMQEGHQPLDGVNTATFFGRVGSKGKCGGERNSVFTLQQPHHAPWPERGSVRLGRLEGEQSARS